MSISSIYFWGAVSVPYLVYRGFSIGEAFSLLGIYSILVVILEFPTGVIGDLYGHKLSVNLSNITGVITMFLLAQNLPHFAYYLVLTLGALSSSMLSGSDDAILKKLSPNFNKDLGTYKSFSAFAAFASVSIGGWLGKINLTLPIYLTGIVWLIATAIVSAIPVDHHRLKGANIFSHSFLSIKLVLASLTLTGIIAYAGVNDGFAMSIKTIINSSAPVLGLDLGYIGLLVGFGLLCRSLGYKYAHTLSKLKNRYLYLAIVTILLAISWLPTDYFSLGLLGIINGLTAVVGIRADLLINSLIGDSVRASVLSLKNLMIRLFSGGYLFIAGSVIEGTTYRYLMFGTLVLYTIAGYYFVRLNGKQYVKAQTTVSS